MTTPRHSNKYEYHFPNEQVYIGRGGARRLTVIINSLDDASCTASIYFYKWKDYMYPFVVQADTPTYQPGVPGGRVRSAFGGALEYTRQGLGVPLYPGNGTGLWQQIGGIHDVTTWSVEGYFVTGSDITTTQNVWMSSDSTVTNYLFARLQAGQLNILNSGGVIISGPTTIAANTAYRMIMVCTAGSPAIYLNGVSQTATGGPITAVPLGTPFFVTVGSGTGGAAPFLGTIGGFSFWRGVALTANQISRHDIAVSSAWTFNTLTQATVAAGSSAVFQIGEGEALPLPNNVFITTTGHTLILTELGE